MNKKEARTLIKERRMNLSMEYIESASDKILEKLLENEDFKNAKVIMSYMDFKNEVKTDKINEYIKDLPAIIGDAIWHSVTEFHFEKREALNKGAYDFMTKPINDKDLHKKLDDVMNIIGNVRA